MSTTIKDFGRHSERFGDIPPYYIFPIKFWFKSEMLIPDDVLTWCRNNCTGFYKVVAYTHEDSVKNGKKFAEKIMYVDKIYLASEDDAALIKLTFKVLEQKISRPRLEVQKRPRRTAEEKAMNPNSPEAILAATRRHAAAQKAAKKAAKVPAKPATVKMPAAVPKVAKPVSEFERTLNEVHQAGKKGIVVHVIK